MSMGFSVIKNGAHSGFGVDHYPDRKNPSLVVYEEPNIHCIVASFSSEEAAEKFSEIFKSLFQKFTQEQASEPTQV